MKRKFALFLFALGLGISAAQAADPRHYNKIHELCGDDPDICYAQLLACLER